MSSAQLKVTCVTRLRRAARIMLRVMPLFRSRLPIITVEPCVPSFAKAPPTGPDWIHEIKHDGFRVIARRDGKKVRLRPVEIQRELMTAAAR